MVVPPHTVTGPGARSRSVNHLDQVTIAHQPGHKTTKRDLAVKYRRGIQVTGSREHRCVPRPPGAVHAAVPQARADSSPRADMMSTFALGHMLVRRSGYGAMQLAGPYAFGAPPDRAVAIGVLQAAVAAGVDHIDTAQYYGPGVVNDLIREALCPTLTGWRSSARSRSGETTAGGPPVRRSASAACRDRGQPSQLAGRAAGSG
jgi:hypothetical protein